MNKSKIIFGFIFFQVGFCIAQPKLEWPQVQSIHKPWTRWWWQGSAVEKKDILWMLDEFNSKGIGGVEITPIYGVKGEESKFKTFLSKDWKDALLFTLKEAQKRSIGVDLANGTGWPFGGPWVNEYDASRSLYVKKMTSHASENWKDSLLLNRDGFVRVANQTPLSVAELEQKMKMGVTKQELAIDQLQYPEKLYPTYLLAIDSTGNKFDWTSKLKDLSLLHDFHGGKWTIYAVYQGLHGKMVERAAPGGEGYAIDHFSLRATQNYLRAFDSVFNSPGYTHLRSFFNDSYEVDDARGQANFSSELFSSFKDKMGYALEMEIPALFGFDSIQKNIRVRHDYRMVIDEMILNNFTGTWTNWAHAKGKLTRNQSHGSPANILDLYSRVDIPETEGTEIMRFKFASSAAHVSGKKIISAEAATWLNENFTSSWAQVKKSVDRYFLGGVNHIIYHGTAYSPKEANWPGWLFYAAVQFQPTNPQWRDFNKLNEYVARVQSWLQQGSPSSDVLLYYPLTDVYSQPGSNLLQHFDGMDKNIDTTTFSKLASWLLENGYSFDFFSDRQLQQFTVDQKHIQTEGRLRAKIILIPSVRYMNENSFKKILSLANEGAQIAFFDKLPEDVPGFYDYTNRSLYFRELKKQLPFSGSGLAYEFKKVGTGTIYLGTDLRKILNQAAIQNERFNAKGLSWTRRELEEGTLYFVDNTSGRKINSLFKLPANRNHVFLMNPMSGVIGKARILDVDEQKEFQLSLDKDETLLVLLSNIDFGVKNYPYEMYLGRADTVSGSWNVKFLEGGPSIPKAFTIHTLKSWTDWPLEGVKEFSGSASYQLQFKWNGNSSSDYLLNLGTVYSTCSVQINGQDFGSLIGPEFKLKIPGSVFKSDNTLQITVSNLMANRIAYMDKVGLNWKRFYNINMSAKHKENLVQGIFSAASWKPFPSGLIGPVSLSVIE